MEHWVTLPCSKWMRLKFSSTFAPLITSQWKWGTSSHCLVAPEWGSKVSSLLNLLIPVSGGIGAPPAFVRQERKVSPSKTSLRWNWSAASPIHGLGGLSGNITPCSALLKPCWGKGCSFSVFGWSETAKVLHCKVTLSPPILWLGKTGFFWSSYLSLFVVLGGRLL